MISVLKVISTLIDRAGLGMINDIGYLILAFTDYNKKKLIMTKLSEDKKRKLYNN